jgi:hypothetical protein
MRWQQQTSSYSYSKVLRWFETIYTLYGKNLTDTSCAWPHGSHVRQPSVKYLCHHGMSHSPSSKPPQGRAGIIRQSSYWATRCLPGPINLTCGQYKLLWVVHELSSVVRRAHGARLRQRRPALRRRHEGTVGARRWLWGTAPEAQLPEEAVTARRGGSALVTSTSGQLGDALPCRGRQLTEFSGRYAARWAPMVGRKKVMTELI